MRSFLALHTNGLVPAGARAVAPENLHLTLAFLGNVPASGRACLEQAAGTIRCQPFELVLDRMGYFQRPQLFWLGPARMPEALLALVAALQQVQRRCVGEPEARPFRAHVTLARKVRREPDLRAPAALHWPVDRFSLVRSQTLPEGPVYRPEGSWLLQP